MSDVDKDKKAGDPLNKKDPESTQNVEDLVDKVPESTVVLRAGNRTRTIFNSDPDEPRNKLRRKSRGKNIRPSIQIRLRDIKFDNILTATTTDEDKEVIDPLKIAMKSQHTSIQMLSSRKTQKCRLHQPWPQ